jgi:hypothetical protein
LTIGDRVGQYPGMPDEIAFNVVWVAPQHGTGEAVEARPDKIVRYKGAQISVNQQ